MSLGLLQPSCITLQNAASKTPKSHKILALNPSNCSSSAKSVNFRKWAVDFGSKSLKFVFSGALAIGITLSGLEAVDAKVGVNKPELLPKEFSPVIDVAGFLSAGQENRLRQEISDLEKDTGFKLRILAQNYPDTPGLAIRDFWKVDDRTIVFVADPTFGSHCGSRHKDW